ncbi:alanine--tRNA ligase [Candidatus Endobugula sertula]|uniref:Alanine--tRNA ligase n=1 Tax=Candidatus Endobugula sertula TaxID=62101 RepID=A0A1D2QM86_9GAMM|nr:alanine--tRNA ligase [Candidatus Endobugula sertula]
MKSSDIRHAFLRFFANKEHTIVPSSPLVPKNDPTLLFTNAGMVQFKDVFLGTDKRTYRRATTSQRCIRAGGKHNDLENVGYTARHHTFFEMLGNFSFGDYFKHDAITYAWEFLTSKEWMGIPTNKLTVTVYEEDEEAYSIWHKKIGIPKERLIRIGDNKGAKYQSDNFWAMGDTGPCGPCTEIFYDHGEHIWGGLPGTSEEDGDRYIEIWNIVFMQFNRHVDGKIEPLPKPSVDTGMGLERISAVMQGVHNNYDIDLFQNLLAATANILGVDDLEEKSLRVIADHIRSCAFLITDGVMPSNEGRGYVLRRIIRRAIRHGHKLGCTDAFFHKLVKALVEEMGETYSELIDQQAQIEGVLLAEEQQFEKTLAKGLSILEKELKKLSTTEIPGKVVFTLYDTYGFPTDLTNDIARERELTLDMEGYEQCMAKQQEHARAAGKFKMDHSENINVDGKTVFSGYELRSDHGCIVKLYTQGKAVEQLQEGDDAIIIISKTPFYAESGGQVGDTGYLVVKDNRFEVHDCQKSGANHLHIGRMIEGKLSINDEVTAQVDNSIRQATALNHSATHLMHAALRKVLGNHVVQKGSLVDAEKLRFDFSHFEAVTTEQLQTVSRLVNDQIRNNTQVQTDLCNMEQAKQKGALMLFDEKYGDEVRVLSMGDGFSIELCGGTHVARTGDIGLFHIVSESGIASGIRRIEAITGTQALSYLSSFETKMAGIAELVKANASNVLDKVEQLVTQVREQEKALSVLQAKLASTSSSDLLRYAKNIADVQVLAHRVDNADAKSLRNMADALKSKLTNGVFLLASNTDDKVSLIAGVTSNLTERFNAGDLIREVAPLVRGKGGGRPDMAQGGGTDPSGIDAVLKRVESWVTK